MPTHKNSCTFRTQLDFLEIGEHPGCVGVRQVFEIHSLICLFFKHTIGFEVISMDFLSNPFVLSDHNVLLLGYFGFDSRLVHPLCHHSSNSQFGPTRYRSTAPC